MRGNRGTPVTDGIIGIIIGIVAVMFGMIADRFNTGFIRSSGRPMPNWLGRTIFTAVGLWFIYMGLRQICRH
jgi:putative Mn2+ efflux pump MntP